MRQQARGAAARSLLSKVHFDESVAKAECAGSDSMVSAGGEEVVPSQRVVDEENALGCGTFGGGGDDDGSDDDATGVFCASTRSRRRDAPKGDDDSGDEVETAARAPHTVILAVAALDQGGEERPLTVEDGKGAGDGSKRPSVVFEALRYEVPRPGGARLTVLDGTTSSFRCGEVTAVMGSSGAGKTSLLDVIAGRGCRGAATGGRVLLGGSAPSEVVRKRYSGYCLQRDTLVDVLTVRETLLCTAELKCSSKVSTQAKRARVEEVLRELGLDDAVVADTRVGNDLDRGISGGQRKRLNIGVALVTKPPVLLLDEPTSGLDAATADDILAVAASLARGGRVVAATLHSPSSRAFRLSVDRLLVLGSRGRVLYSGPSAVDRTAQLCLYLSHTLKAPLREGDSLADHVIYVMASRGADDDRLAAAWSESSYGVAEAEVARAAAAAASRDGTSPMKLGGVDDCLAWHADDARRMHAVATSPWHGVATLFRYRSRKSYVDGEYVGVRLGDKLIFGLVLGTLYFNEAKKHRDDGHATNVAGLLWLTVVLPGYGAAAYIPQLVDSRATFVREVADGCYGVATFVVWRCVEEFAIMLPFAAVFAALLYFLVGFQCSFLVFFLNYYLNSCIGIAMAYAVAAFSPTTEAVNRAGQGRFDGTSTRVSSKQSPKGRGLRASRSPREMIARPKMSQKEWTSTEIRGFEKVGTRLTLFLPRPRTRSCRRT